MSSTFKTWHPQEEQRGPSSGRAGEGLGTVSAGPPFNAPVGGAGPRSGRGAVLTVFLCCRSSYHAGHGGGSNVETLFGFHTRCGGGGSESRFCRQHLLLHCPMHFQSISHPTHLSKTQGDNGWSRKVGQDLEHKEHCKKMQNATAHVLA